MNLPTEIFGHVIVVHTPEEFGEDQAGPFEAYVPTLERNNVVLDLDSTERLDSAGLGALLNVYDKLREEGGDLKITTTNFSNRKILEITRLDQQLEVFSSVIDAVKSFQRSNR
ncbi:MAG: anti-anti-sigma factor [Planctomycetes bacterium RBG_16_64_12]|nr:MAG: anti-anti-sigma factor [Planctomycetes bacterium RBG_16_64_12]